MADYVPEGLPDTGVVATEGQNQPQTTTATVDAAMEPSGGNTMLSALTQDPTDLRVGEARGTVLFELPELTSLSESQRKGFIADHVEARLKGREKIALKQLVISLKAAKARLQGDREPLVMTGADAVRWLLQQVADAWIPVTATETTTVPE